MQKVLNGYRVGILVLQVQLQSVDPPEQVIAAFKDVTAAQQDQNRLRNEAESYANRVVPEARGKAAAIVQEAEGYRLQTVAQATGQVSRFNQIYAQYKKAPEVVAEQRDGIAFDQAAQAIRTWLIVDCKPQKRHGADYRADASFVILLPLKSGPIRGVALSPSGD